MQYRKAFISNIFGGGEQRKGGGEGKLCELPAIDAVTLEGNKFAHTLIETRSPVQRQAKSQRKMHMRIVLVIASDAHIPWLLEVGSSS